MHRKLMFWILIPAAAGLIVAVGFALDANLTESLYSRGGYPVLVAILSPIAKLSDKSIAEHMVLAILPLLITVFLAGIASSWSKSKSVLHSVMVGLGSLATTVIALISILMVGYGINFFRLPVDSIFRLPSLEESMPTNQVLEVAATRTNFVRQSLENLDHSERGISELESLIIPIQAAFLAKYDLPSTNLGVTKTLKYSNFWLSIGVGGYYWPLTIEPNISSQLAPYIRPFAIAHERAHLQGFGTEDACDFIAMMTVWKSEDLTIEYSGWLIFWLRGLSLGADVALLDKQVYIDINNIISFATDSKGDGAGSASKLRDLTMKSLGQEKGVHAYDGSFELAVRYISKNLEFFMRDD